ncbi:MAG: hypothetical protein M1318_03650 [Firmicutes bacterium]|jgi:hypothetical protein|nr:hypothetical protein [Bacillota bacterium]
MMATDCGGKEGHKVLSAQGSLGIIGTLFDQLPLALAYDLEQLPSGKFAANPLVLYLACLTYNLLRVIGQATIGRQDVPRS